MTKPAPKRFSKSFLIGGMIVLFLILLVSAFFFFRTLKEIRQEGWKHPPKNPIGMFISGERPMIEGTGSIEGWMTFDFVNAAFGLEPKYLKDMLRIQDEKYPRISIDRYARKIGFQKEDFLGMVRRAVELREITPQK